MLLMLRNSCLEGEGFDLLRKMIRESVRGQAWWLTPRSSGVCMHGSVKGGISTQCEIYCSVERTLGLGQFTP